MSSNSHHQPQGSKKSPSPSQNPPTTIPSIQEAFPPTDKNRIPSQQSKNDPDKVQSPESPFRSTQSSHPQQQPKNDPDKIQSLESLFVRLNRLFHHNNLKMTLIKYKFPSPLFVRRNRLFHHNNLKMTLIKYKVRRPLFVRPNLLFHQNNLQKTLLKLKLKLGHSPQFLQRTHVLLNLNRLQALIKPNSLIITLPIRMSPRRNLLIKEQKMHALKINTLEKSIETPKAPKNHDRDSFLAIISGDEGPQILK
ncbi:hypothetical protein K1719_033937 [Acacia pycnantha]|nr:hypothetical protein K1719_033937 [Acacia pycnantha]